MGARERKTLGSQSCCCHGIPLTVGQCAALQKGVHTESTGIASPRPGPARAKLVPLLTGPRTYQYQPKARANRVPVSRRPCAKAQASAERRFAYSVASSSLRVPLFSHRV